MANRKNKVEKQSLPLVNSENKYLVRYRVVLDKTKPSDWSNIYSIPAKAVALVNGVVRLNGGVIDVIWENSNNLTQYDVFVKYQESATYQHHGRTTAHNYSIIPQSGSTIAYVLVQAASTQKKPSAVLKVFEGNVSL
jgi:hypothetical protein